VCNIVGHALMENRHGLVVQADATQANGTAAEIVPRTSNT
jgi:hypothetical protein